MNSRLLSVLSVFLLAAFALAPAGSAAPPNKQRPDKPVITAINGATVRVRVPAGFRKVTLETRAAQTAKWKEQLVARLSGEGGVVKFVLKKRPVQGMLRVTGST